MRLSVLLLLIFVFLSCSKDKEPGCSKYFLSEYSRAGGVYHYFYNEDGSLGLMEYYLDVSPSEILHYDFIYDGNKRLKQITETFNGQDRDHYDFYFNASGQLSNTSITNQDGEIPDSLIFSYDASGRVIRQDLYRFGDAYNYTTYTYEDNILKLDFYSAVLNKPEEPFRYSGTFEYTLDDKPVPFPIEAGYWLSSFGNTVLTHNVVELRIYGGSGADTDDTTEIKYNEAGLPVSTSDVESFTYDCESPKKQ